MYQNRKNYQLPPLNSSHFFASSPSKSRAKANTVKADGIVMEKRENPGNIHHQSYFDSPQNENHNTR